MYAGHDLFQSSLIRDNSSIEVAGPVVSLTIEGLDLVNLTEPLVIELKVQLIYVFLYTNSNSSSGGLAIWPWVWCKEYKEELLLLVLYGFSRPVVDANMFSLGSCAQFHRAA